MAELRRKMKQLNISPTEAWKAYQQKTKGMKQMTKAQWMAKNYPEPDTQRTRYVSHRLKGAGLSQKEINKLRGR